MKFGKNIQKENRLNKGLHYVNFKTLKKKIKNIQTEYRKGNLKIAGELNSQFTSLIESELFYVNETYYNELNELFLLRREVAEQFAVADIQANPEEFYNISFDQLLNRLQNAGLTDGLYTMCATLGKVSSRCRRLRRYVIWNSVAIVKIIKKKKKRTPEYNFLSPTASDVLSKQPWYCSSEMTKLLSAIDTLIEDVMQKLTLQPPSLERYTCPICLELIVDPVTLRGCFHRFCWNCLAKAALSAQETGQELERCPSCRTACILEPESFEVDGILNQFLRHYFPEDTRMREAHDLTDRDSLLSTYYNLKEFQNSQRMQGLRKSEHVKESCDEKCNPSYLQNMKIDSYVFLEDGNYDELTNLKDYYLNFDLDEGTESFSDDHSNSNLIEEILSIDGQKKQNNFPTATCFDPSLNYYGDSSTNMPCSVVEEDLSLEKAKLGRKNSYNSFLNSSFEVDLRRDEDNETADIGEMMERIVDSIVIDDSWTPGIGNDDPVFEDHSLSYKPNGSFSAPASFNNSISNAAVYDRESYASNNVSENLMNNISFCPQLLETDIANSNCVTKVEEMYTFVRETAQPAAPHRKDSFLSSETANHRVCYNEYNKDYRNNSNLNNNIHLSNDVECNKELLFLLQLNNIYEEISCSSFSKEEKDQLFSLLNRMSSFGEGAAKYFVSFGENSLQTQIFPSCKNEEDVANLAYPNSASIPPPPPPPPPGFGGNSNFKSCEFGVPSSANNSRNSSVSPVKSSPVYNTINGNIRKDNSNSNSSNSISSSVSDFSDLSDGAPRINGSHNSTITATGPTRTPSIDSNNRKEKVLYTVINNLPQRDQPGILPTPKESPSPLSLIAALANQNATHKRKSRHNRLPQTIKTSSASTIVGC